MITVEEAWSFLDQIAPLTPVEKPLDDALQYVLSETIPVPYSLPFFDNSAMDGYAGRITEMQTDSTLPVLKTLAAGDQPLDFLPEGYVVQIFTGAPVPPGADTVIRREDTLEAQEKIKIIKAPEKIGQNIRKKGEQIQRGMPLMAARDLLTPAGIGLLAASGIQQCRVFPKPHVIILITGDELLQAGQAWKEGKIYESHQAMLTAALVNDHFHSPQCLFVGDSLPELEAQLRKALTLADAVFITGGVSMGDKDYVKPALQNIGAEILFHKIKQKPGKPVLFAKYKKIPILGLPGNPGSALTGYHLFGKMILKKLMGCEKAKPTWREARISHLYQSKAGLTRFLKAIEENQQIEILLDQDSNSLVSFARANALLCMPPDMDELQLGQMVRYMSI